MRHPDSVPSLHRAFLDRAVPLLAADRRIVGIAAAGSYAANEMDEFSDIDLVLACEPAEARSVLDGARDWAGKLGPLTAAFTGEHVAEPRLLICLFGPPALHVDFKVVMLGDLETRVDDPVVLWERDGRMSAAYGSGKGFYPEQDPQWIEDRFWVWVHYGALKIARGEWQEALDFLSFLRVSVLGPLGLKRAGLPPTGVRRVERNPALAALLAGTVGQLNRPSLLHALAAAVQAYKELRPPSLEFNRDAEALSLAFVAQVERHAVLPSARDSGG